ncbi:hypothetical protein [Arenibaculum sp.]|jgi:hypothetical protein|uniref:hypothetical protein n=1 Tax=Arenibaculum sp. TaxID=2865862 RepID=UPI002E0FE3B8|nr:hypothetical protein [Arenibaculum sp.]
MDALLGGGFMGGTGMPPINLNGGHAGPSGAGSDGAQSSWMASPFAVGSGASSSASPSVGPVGGGAAGGGDLLLYAALGLGLLALVMAARK